MLSTGDAAPIRCGRSQTNFRCQRPNGPPSKPPGPARGLPRWRKLRRWPTSLRTSAAPGLARSSRRVLAPPGLIEAQQPAIGLPGATTASAATKPGNGAADAAAPDRSYPRSQGAAAKFAAAPWLLFTGSSWWWTDRPAWSSSIGSCSHPAGRVWWCWWSSDSSHPEPWWSWSTCRAAAGWAPASWLSSSSSCFRPSSPWNWWNQQALPMPGRVRLRSPGTRLASDVSWNSCGPPSAKRGHCSFDHHGLRPPGCLSDD